MKRHDYWYEDELYDLDNVYNVEKDENYSNTPDSSLWYN